MMRTSHVREKKVKPRNAISSYDSDILIMAIVFWLKLNSGSTSCYKWGYLMSDLLHYRDTWICVNFDILKYCVKNFIFFFKTFITKMYIT